MLKTTELKPAVNRRAAEAVARKQQFLRQASLLFRRKGYRLTSLAEIIACSGGSRETLAKYYKNKAGLYAAVIHHGAVEFVAQTDLATLKGTPEQVLLIYGELALRFFLQPAALMTYRDVISEGIHAPEIAKAFYQTGHRHLTDALSAQLADWHGRALISSSAAEVDADFFTHLLRAGIHERVLLGMRPRATDAEIRASVSDAVRVFLKGIAR
jgi:AcrR family transcriptional regulator